MKHKIKKYISPTPTPSLHSWNNYGAFTQLFNSNQKPGNVRQNQEIPKESNECRINHSGHFCYVMM